MSESACPVTAGNRVNIAAFVIAYMRTRGIKGLNQFRPVFSRPHHIAGIVLDCIRMTLVLRDPLLQDIADTPGYCFNYHPPNGPRLRIQGNHRHARFLQTAVVSRSKRLTGGFSYGSSNGSPSISAMVFLAADCPLIKGSWCSVDRPISSA